MIEKIRMVTDYLKEIPIVFLITIICVLGLILFIPLETAKVLAVDKFRDNYRIFIGPIFLLTMSFLIGRILIFITRWYSKKRSLKLKQKSLHRLTPEEKGYLIPYIRDKKNTIYVDIRDGIMNGLNAKGITYVASNVGDLFNGIAFNLQPWAREYIEKNPHLLDGYKGQPMTLRQKLYLR